jgi:endonuclease/exonuclease/phosphatase family metal-dependent hydrolase
MCGALLALSAIVVLTGTSTSASGESHRKSFVRVMTYNIHVGVGIDNKLDLARIAQVIKREHPDFVGLQEVDRGVERTKRVDEIAELARLTRMEYAFAYNLHYQGGHYGVAVLSRYPILSVDHRRYDNTREARRRGFIRIEADVEGRRLAFLTTHLDYQHEDGRRFETKQLLDALAPTPEPLIVVGDFNAEPDDSAYKLMLTRFTDAWTQQKIAGSFDAGNTYPADKPAKRIDYIFCAKQSGVRVRTVRVLGTLASDHRPVMADLEF